MSLKGKGRIMDLNTHEKFSQIDSEKMLEHIDGLPAQLKQAYELGMGLPLPDTQPIEKIVCAGMGGSAIGADLLASCLSDRLTVPFIVHRDYGLPEFAAGSGTLVIASSHSGNTEETLSAFKTALERKCQVVIVSTGGELEKEGKKAGVPVWNFEHVGQPRAAVGFSFGLLLALLIRLGLVADQKDEIEESYAVMTTLQSRIKADVPVLQNPAKRQAGQFVGRHVMIFAGGFLSPVARRWKTQFNEVAKAFAVFEPLPEADHNTLAGIYNPAQQVSQEYAMFLEASLEHPRNLLKLTKTRELFMLEGIATDSFNARGISRMAQIWSTLFFGDYVAYYLALLYDTDPTPIPPIVALKEAMSSD
jgi:glucose/mannose-6-phosphate isomerase